MAGNALQQQSQFFHAEGFGHVVICTVFHRLNGRVDRAVAGDDHDDGLGPALANLMQSLQPSRSRQFPIEQHNIDVLCIQQAVGMLGGVSHHRIKA